ncbi:PR-1-like protein [Ramaria rubella]|nr:PR-1-like protein [Ramaria rubella]
MALVILTGFLTLALVPGGYASPTGVRGRSTSPSDLCVAGCRANFGWPGHPFPSDPWGLVVNPKIVSSADGEAGPIGAGGVEASPTTSSAEAVYTSVLAPASSSNVTIPTFNSTSATPITSALASPSPSASAFALQPSSSFSPSPKSSSSPPPHPSSAISSTPPPSPSSQPAIPSSSPLPPPSPSSSPSPSPLPSSSPSSAPAPASTDSDEGSGSTSGATSESDIQAYLAGHNTVRAQHGASPLTYSQDLAAKAQQWANGCVFQHSGGSLGPFGENLAAGTGDGYGIPQALASWTNEVSQYDPSNPQPSHFTQVVWKATTQVGCALQNCDGIFPSSFGQAHYYVCEYSPQGNIIGEFGSEVQA